MPFARFMAKAEEKPDQVAVSNDWDRATFGELRDQVAAIRPLLIHRPVVLLALPGGPQFTAIVLACLAEMAPLAPIPAKSTAREVEDFLRLIRPGLVVVEAVKDGDQLLAGLTDPTTILACQEGGQVPPCHRLIHWDDVRAQDKAARSPIPNGTRELPDGTALIQFTSGSTGKPKGILLSRDNLASFMVNNRDYLESFRDQHVFCPMPQFHAFGGTVALEHLVHGSPVHLANRFLPAADLTRLQEFGCTTIAAAPNYFKLLLALNLLTKERLPAFNTAVMGTAMVDQGLLHQLAGRFPLLQFHLRYGLTETMGPLTRLSIRADQIDKFSPGLVGAPVEGIEVEPGLPLLDQGLPREIRVRSSVIADSQLFSRGNWEPLVAADRFFSTGDTGFLDGDDQLYLRGRISSFIKRNGFRINPFEIESLLREVDGVQEAVVVGLADPLAGQQIVAIVEPFPDSSKSLLAELKNACGNNLAAYKFPQKYIIVEDLPRTASGKPDRTRIIAEIT